MSPIRSAAALACVSLPAWGADVRLNSIGFAPDATKVATVDGAQEGPFVIVRLGDGAEVLAGEVRPTATGGADAGQGLADFSRLQAAGRYEVRFEGSRSAPFEVGPGRYDDPFRVVMRAMYLWRCGAAVRAEHNGDVFEHGPCHLDDAHLDHVGAPGQKRPGVGGWHDAGDYNKYVVNAGVTVGCMVRAWEDFGPRIEAQPIGLPEREGPLPEFLAELKWETDWVLTMQAPDGSVYHKLSAIDFDAFEPPEAEKAPRYFTPWGSAATADLVGMLSAMARVVKPYDAEYANACLEAASRSRAFLAAHPEDHQPDQSAFHTGGYGSPDWDDRLWAAAEYWETTGDAAALAEVEAWLRSPPPAGGRWGGDSQRRGFDVNFDWNNVKNLALLTYLGSQRPGRDPQLVRSLREDLVAVADRISETAGRQPYGRPLGEVYHWGSNGSVARQSLLLEAAWRLTGDEKHGRAQLDALGYLFGRNPWGRSMVTGLGASPPLRPHDRRSGSDAVDAPWPGYLVGGPDQGPLDWRDEEPDYRTNEVAINWNGALIYALAAQLSEPPGATPPSASE